MGSAARETAISHLAEAASCRERSRRPAAVPSPLTRLGLALALLLAVAGLDAVVVAGLDALK